MISGSPSPPLTDFGRKSIKFKPERIVEVNTELARMGVQVKEQYALIGQYDFVSIVEAPDNETIFKMVAEMTSRGSVRLIPLPALDVKSFISNISSLR